jgi:hypothetical protein
VGELIIAEEILEAPPFASGQFMALGFPSRLGSPKIEIIVSGFVLQGHVAIETVPDIPILIKLGLISLNI